MSNLYYPAGTIIHSKRTKRIFRVAPKKNSCTNCIVGILAARSVVSCTSIINTILDIPISRGACNDIIPPDYMFEEITGGL